MRGLAQGLNWVCMRVWNLLQLIECLVLYLLPCICVAIARYFHAGQVEMPSQTSQGLVFMVYFSVTLGLTAGELVFTKLQAVVGAGQGLKGMVFLIFSAHRTGLIVLLPTVLVSICYPDRESQAFPLCWLSAMLVSVYQSLQLASELPLTWLSPAVQLMFNFPLPHWPAQGQNATMRTDASREVQGAMLAMGLILAYVWIRWRQKYQAAQRLQEYLDVMPIAAFVTDDAKTLKPLNKEAENLLAASDLQKFANQQAGTALLKSKRTLQEYLGDVLKGTSRKLEDYVALMSHTRKGSVQYDVGGFRVREGRVGMYLREHKRNDSVEESFKNGLVRSLSHELCTPLNALLLLLRLNEKSKEKGRGSEEEGDPSLRIALSNAEVLHSKIQDLIAYTKFEVGEMRHNPRLFDIAVLFGELQKIFHYEAKSKSNTLSFMVISKEELQIVADEKLIRQILIKLISNAIKYTKNGLIQISVLAKQRSLDVMFKVQDSGIGMPPEKAQILFSGLSRKHVMLTSKWRSSRLAGLGLMIAQKLCQTMHSNLHVASEPGKGTMFTFNIESCRTLSHDGLKEGSISPRHPRKNSCSSSTRVPSTPSTLPAKRSHSKSRDMIYVGDDDIPSRHTKLSRSKRVESEEPSDVEVATEGSAVAQIVHSHTVIHTSIGEEPKMPTRTLTSTKDVRFQAGLTERPRTSKQRSHKKLFTEIESESKKVPKPAVRPRAKSKCPLMNEFRGAKKNQSHRPSYYARGIQEEDKEAEDEKPPAHGTPCVIVADDGAGNRYVLKEMLNRYKLVVKEASDGQEAYQLVKSCFEGRVRESLQLILMDLDMPRLDGIQATRKIRNLEYKMKRELEVPIVAVTAFDNDTDKAACFEARMQMFITKPVDFATLKEVITKYMHFESLQVSSTL